MKKIKDRFALGIICGLGGNISKRILENYFIKIGFSNSSGRKTAAGIFLKKHQISKPYGKVVGEIADHMIAAGLGVTCVYWLSFMGKDHYLLKGGGLGAAEWTSLYGVASHLGATHIFPVSPKDAVANFLSHVAFGTTKTFLAVRLGDEELFNPRNLSHKINHHQRQFSIPLRGNDSLCPPAAAPIADQGDQTVTASVPGCRQT
ncbi:hypothetical protein [Dehalobacterium formicoaceticum]|uniref:Uncharacterized protein n=1 Tax=Dehalobacterium formicoaceticum TaxID=51515 RepID=A0ABT1Y561_9FIRM|nr:hypothetical protein [Dehalobacterium formicoaceticum]MCR6546018.1 hypothetical protein [Dehalobacterium formicoaceticum]